jgi:DNA-binding NtrC family response regulator
VTRSTNYDINNFTEDQHWRDIQQDVGILGDTETIRQLIETIEQVARTDISILITGESGTGKELVAKAIHLRSKRRSEPLITVNSGAIPEGILESELFGHEKGSFTGAVGPRKGYFELADKGSIFLDEIGELPLTIQVKLLRVLEEREFMRVGGTVVHQVDVRFITATNKNLEEEVRRGQFRQDLYYRLNAMNIRVPALRERREDIPLLAKKFAADFSRENHIEFNGFDDSALFALQQYSWPGNIRELRNTVEKVIVMERGQRISETVLKKYIQPTDQRSHSLPVPITKPKDEIERELLLRVLLEIKSEISQLRELVLSGVRIPYRLSPWREEFPAEYAEQVSIDDSEEQKQGRSIAEVERELIIDTLMRTGGNKRKTAEILGMSERTLYRKINRYGLRRARR